MQLCAPQYYVCAPSEQDQNCLPPPSVREYELVRYLREIRSAAKGLIGREKQKYVW